MSECRIEVTGNTGQNKNNEMEASQETDGDGQIDSRSQMADRRARSRSQWQRNVKALDPIALYTREPY